jgi:asparagine synthase (glutamine-hydrolysing)
MCGIVGALAFKQSAFRITKQYISRMRDTMVHRGPDGAGTWISHDQRVGLGHRRLSIIEPTATAAQPMCNEDQSVWVSFNGEIYNSAEIRSELEQIGTHQWKTHHSDTEVILHAFEEWGIQCLEKFRGMFAIALWDGRARELWLIRDRLGIKPLYYSIHHGRITFASEIKALLQDPEQGRRVNEEALFHYLTFLTSPAPQTLFDGIHKLAAGVWLQANEDGKIREHRYWDVWDHTTPLTNISEEEIAERLLSELRTAVKLHKISDVPEGVFLSGGIDSSTNAALFSDGEERPIKTFSIGYKGKHQSYANELKYARKMARAIGATYYEQRLDLRDLLDFLPRMIELQDEPIADPVCVPVYRLAKLARENGVTVCHVGEGSDELFWGYSSWKKRLTLQYMSDKLPWTLPKSLMASYLSSYPKLRRNAHIEWLRRAGAGQPIFWGGTDAFSEFEKRHLLSPRLRKRFSQFSSYDAIRPIRERFEEKAWEPSHLPWMTYVDLHLRLPELLLMRVDKMSMGASVEGRVPFLDHKFVEFAMSIPEVIKTKNGTLKYILKKAVRSVIPDELIDRKKQGFAVPIQDWFLDGLNQKIREEVIGFCRRVDFLDANEVTRLLDEGRTERLWYLLNLAMWWRRHFDTPSSTEVSYANMLHSRFK